MYLALREPFLGLNRYNGSLAASIFNSNFSNDRYVWSPEVDLVEFADRYELKMELAGVDPKAVSINVKDDLLTIAGEKEVAKEADDAEEIYVSESRNGKFQRSFRLKSIDNGTISASSRNGVLQIILPKKAESRPKAVEIKVS